jgi:hypothetical protein
MTVYGVSFLNPNLMRAIPPFVDSPVIIKRNNDMNKGDPKPIRLTETGVHDEPF